MMKAPGCDRRKAVWGCIAFAVMIAAPVFAQSDPVESAHGLYTSAAYDDALRLLDGLRPSAERSTLGRIEYYRALCLLALGRPTDADTAIEAAVDAMPFAQPSASDTSPRVRAAFRDVRRRVLPTIIEHRFADAKAAFDRKDTAAAERFREVLALIDEPDIQDVAGQSELAQIRALAADYFVLSSQRK
jgi:hypothetical protein